MKKNELYEQTKPNSLNQVIGNWSEPIGENLPDLLTVLNKPENKIKVVINV